MNRLAIFDCDGTLVDSGATIRAALEQAFAAHGVECPPAEVTRKVIGLSLMESMAALAPDGDHAALIQSYKQAFFAMRAAGRVEEPLFDGIVELLDALEADGWLLGVATGKSDRGLRHCLEAHGLAGAALRCRSPLRSGRGLAPTAGMAGSRADRARR